MDKDKIKDILEYVGFGEKLRKLQNGIDTSVFKNFDEEGFEPSGGEGQKEKQQYIFHIDYQVLNFVM